MEEDIKQKIAGYTAYREKNQQTLNSLLSTETQCHNQGKTISDKIASIAAAQSCQAQMDANKIDKQMTELGGKCETVFKEINALQVAMRTSFKALQADLEAGQKYASKSAILKANCPKEVKTTTELVQGFLTLEESIVMVEGRSVDGKVNYGRFKTAAADLTKVTQAKGDACGDLASLAGALAAPAITGGRAGAGGGAVLSGKSPHSQSDITGQIDNERLGASGGSAGIDPGLGMGSASGISGRTPSGIVPSAANGGSGAGFLKASTAHTGKGNSQGTSAGNSYNKNENEILTPSTTSQLLDMPAEASANKSRSSQGAAATKGTRDVLLAAMETAELAALNGPAPSNAANSSGSGSGASSHVDYSSSIPGASPAGSEEQTQSASSGQTDQTLFARVHTKITERAPK
jgi:hypothetical protein